MERQYPPHRHQFVVVFYKGSVIDRMFGPFRDRTVAKDWAKQYNKLYAPEGHTRLYARIQVFPICWALPLAPALEPG